MNKILFTILLSILLVPASMAQSVIRGTVSDSINQQPLPSVLIELHQNGKLIARTTSGLQGEYRFEQIKPASYSIKAVLSQYKEVRITNIHLATDTTLQVDFAMSLETPPDLIVEVDLDEDLVLMEVEAADMTVESYQLSAVAVEKRNFGRAGKVRSKHYEAGGEFPAMNTESYDFIKENTFQGTRSQPLSTFSIDVDRASYANVRRFLNMNQMPVKDAIRIEEMINYFDYDYPQPTDDHPFSINLESGECPWNPEHKIVQIGLQGEDMSTHSIPPNNLVFLVDVSGSMRGSHKLGLLQKSFHILIDQMRPQDRIAIVAYAGAAGLVLPSTSNKEKIRQALNMLEAGGSTAGGQGIKLAYKVAMENFIEEGNNRVILATDGDFNVGTTNNGSLVRMIEEKRKSGVFLTILGFGMGNYKDSRMEQLSNAGNGNYAYIDNILEAKKVFGKELWGTLYTIAKDVKIQIEFNPAYVQAYRLIGYENRMLENKDFDDDKKDAGEIGAGHSVTALYEIIPAGVESEWVSEDKLKYQKQVLANSNEVFTVKFRYKKPDGDKSILLQQSISERDFNRSQPVSKNFMWATTVAELGMLMRDSEFKQASGYDKLITRAKASKGEDPYGYRAEFIQLARKASLMND